ncbi:MAG TPA: hypothetical protein PLU46_08940 [Thiotrichales bacterium]|nr:hypothetical protein [Thiotrichales bacterium]
MNAESGLIEVALYIHQKKRRFYRVVAGCDLLGDFILYQSWGSLDSKLGNFKQQIVEQANLPKLLNQIHKLRLKHEYLQYEG